MRKKIILITALLLQSLLLVVSANPTFDLNNYRGKVVYVDFWASWCVPCRASFPFMQDMAEKYGNSLTIVAINVDTNRADAAHFLEEFDVNFEIVYDPDGELAESFDVKGMPTSLLYDRQGQLLGSHIGFRTRDIKKLESALIDAIGD